jgi:hypothetical protein
MRLDVLSGEFAIARLDASVNFPAWAQSESPTAFLSITRTRDELSIVCESSQVPAEVAAERGWRCLKVAGPLDFSLVGVLASLAGPLARAGIPIFAISTFDTDYLLVNAAKLELAIGVLESADHVVGEMSSGRRKADPSLRSE